jgi:regulator of sigma E protease
MKGKVSIKKTVFFSALAFIGALSVFHEPTRWVVFMLGIILFMVTVHEAGHLFAARKAGLAAPLFSIGFGPALLKTQPQKSGTVYQIAALPFGGFVRLKGLDEPESSPEDPDSWQNISRPRKIFVAAAGPLANVALSAACLMLLLAAAGSSTATLTVDPVEGSLAESANVLPGDTIVSVQGDLVADPAELISFVNDLDADSIELVVAREDGALYPLTIPATDGSIGLQFRTETEKLSPPQLILNTVDVTWALGHRTISSLSTLASSLVSLPQQLTGESDDPENRALSPLGASRIAQDISESSGWEGIVSLIAIFSMFLAVFNLIPIPPLDGGHIAVTSAEGIFSKVSGKEVEVPTVWLQKATAFTVALILVVGISSFVLDVVKPI